ncbi:hypothetical protein [Effusibacillus consociatus]|uniref:YtkA-like domain-containing protein n=1 Tax=Effusibacillus consociatus TaxID=1117041 RepID=A0ABV9Q427_9BACL
MPKLGLGIVLVGLTVLTACGQAKDPHGQEGQHDQHNQPHGGHESTNTSQVQAVWKFASQTPESKKEEELSIQIQDNTGKPIEKFEISHEKKLHLIVVSKDLSYFNHIHPEYTEKGIFKIKTQFPSGGDYKLIADFIPEGGGAKTESQWIQVQGDAPAQKPIQPETNFTKVVDGKEVTLSLDNLQAGKELTMSFTIKDAATKQPITNLEQYLGAVGHVVILSADAEKYIHNHPLEEKATGPVAKFGTSFPTSGTYKIWGQFQHQGKVFTVPFVINVP